jgi:SAM-dependent methyltransferase
VNREALGRRFARAATTASVAAPRLWRLFRGPLQRNFDRLAPHWEASRSADYFAPYEAALAALPEAPERVLDIGTGTGLGVRAIARRFPAAALIGVDLSPAMVEEARRRAPGPRFEVADAAHLPFADGAFDLVALGNMIPFFDELARMVAPGGHALLAYSSGPDTPIWVPPERLRAELTRRGFTEFADVLAGRGSALLARKPVAS